MSENTELRSQRLTKIEDFAVTVQASKNEWLDEKANAAAAKKVYDDNADALLRMIAEKSDAPLFDEETDDDSEDENG